MWQAEAMWLNFSNQRPGWDLDFPVAIKVAAGKINAVTGEAWRTGLHRDPQDYMVFSLMLQTLAARSTACGDSAESLCRHAYGAASQMYSRKPINSE